MHTLSDAILKTLAYFDVFEYAPTVVDMERWLLKTSKPYTVHDIQVALASDKRISHIQGFYTLQGREHLAELRKHKYMWTEQKWKRTHRYIRLLASMPYVEGVWLVNSMGWENARKGSDIDLLIVATPGHIWSARFWTTAMMKLLRQRPHEQAQERALCLSLYVAADSLDLQPYRLNSDDIHYTFWVNQCYPIFDTGRYDSFVVQNQWINTVFADAKWTQQSERRAVYPGLFGRTCKRILQRVSNERLFKTIQWRIMPLELRSLANTDQRVVLNNTILKLHTNDTREDRHTAWKERVEQLQHL